MAHSNYQRWLCELKIDGMHPQTTPLSAVFHLKFGENGGICGTKKKSNEEENPRFKLLSRSTYGIQNTGDVFGEWTETGLCFTLVTRQQACKWEFQGKWEEKFKNVPEGRFKVTQGNFRKDTTVGTFKISLRKKSEENDTIAMENISVQNMKQYILNSPADKHFYDFKIVAQDGSEVNSHKIILASQTQYFGGLFRQENPDFVNLDFPSDIIKMCVNYLYTEDIDVNGDNVQDVMVFANYVMIMEVVKICEDFITNNLDQGTCLDVFKLGDFLGNSAITDQAKKMICRNFQTILLEDELTMIPLHLFKQVLSSDKLILYSEYGTILPGIEREVKLGEMIEKYCLVNSMENEREVLKANLRIDQNNQISSHRELSHLKTWTVIEKMGSAGDSHRHVQSFSIRGEGTKFIRQITLCTVTWYERTIIGGLTFRWCDGSSETVGSMAETGTSSLTEMEVPEGEHVSFVIGNSGYYVDDLTFVASSGRKIGPVDPVGGDGGGFRNPLSPLDPKFDSFNTYLDGVQGEEVVTDNKKVVTKLRFIYSCLTNGEELQDVLAGSDMNDDEEENLM
eukprot:GFUD01069333.1.p1 GENE.GFUD01069333.1~~GFUD01069333.1.p1  ORF type:complete len:566 (+),score=144.80 GFUD01069333.1:433-2130(+)